VPRRTRWANTTDSGAQELGACLTAVSCARVFPLLHQLLLKQDALDSVESGGSRVLGSHRAARAGTRRRPIRQRRGSTYRSCCGATPGTRARWRLRRSERTTRPSASKPSANRSKCSGRPPARQTPTSPLVAREGDQHDALTILGGVSAATRSLRGCGSRAHARQNGGTRHSARAASRPPGWHGQIPCPRGDVCQGGASDLTGAAGDASSLPCRRLAASCEIRADSLPAPAATSPRQPARVPLRTECAASPGSRRSVAIRRRADAYRAEREPRSPSSSRAGHSSPA